MASSVSRSEALLCAAAFFFSHSICWTLVLILHFKRCKTAFQIKWFGAGYMLSFTCTLVLGSLCMILFSQSGSSNVKSFLVCIRKGVHLLWGYFCIYVTKGASLSRWCSRRHIYTFQSPPSFQQCHKRTVFFHVLSRIVVILSLHSAPLVTWAEQVSWTGCCPQSCLLLPSEQLSASAGKTASSFSVSIISSSPAVLGSADDSEELYGGIPRFCLDQGLRSRPAAARATVKRSFGCLEGIEHRKLAANVMRSCSLVLSRKKASTRPLYIASYYYLKKGRLHITCCRPKSCLPLMSQPLLRIKAPPSCIFFCFTPRRLAPAGAVTGDSNFYRHLFNLCTVQSAVHVGRSPCSATLLPAERSSHIFRQSNVNACGSISNEWFLSWGSIYSHDEHKLPVAFRTPHKSKVACSATAESRAHTLLEQIKKLTIVEVSELVTLIEQSFGVPAARAAPAYLAEDSRSQKGETEKEDGAAQSKAEKKTAFSVEIKSVPLEKRIVVIKTLRIVRPDLGLKDAKGVIDALPNTILNNVSKEKAEEAQKILVDAGAQVEIK